MSQMISVGTVYTMLLSELIKKKWIKVNANIFIMLKSVRIPFILHPA